MTPSPLTPAQKLSPAETQAARNTMAENTMAENTMAENTLSREAILSLTGRELDAAVAEWVMGWSDFWQDHETSWIDAGGMEQNGFVWVMAYPPGMSIEDEREEVMFYSTDANACGLMEAEIEQRDYAYIYLDELAGLLGLDVHTQRGYMAWDPAACFTMMTAPLDVKCRAALLAVMDTKEGGNAE